MGSTRDGKYLSERSLHAIKRAPRFPRSGGSALNEASNENVWVMLQPMPAWMRTKATLPSGFKLTGINLAWPLKLLIFNLIRQSIFPVSLRP